MYDTNLIIRHSKVIDNLNNLNKNVSKSQNQNFSFRNIFEEEVENKHTIQFSKHANMRLNARNIIFSPEQLKRVENGIDDAKSKGVNDSLVLVDNIALVVNVDSRTVITAFNNEQKNIFTNIDGAVIV